VEGSRGPRSVRGAWALLCSGACALGGLRCGLVVRKNTQKDKHHGRPLRRKCVAFPFPQLPSFEGRVDTVDLQVGPVPAENADDL